MDQQNTKRRRLINSNTWTGFLFLLVGAVLLMKQSGFPFPPWLFSWPMVLITVGVLVGIRHGLRSFNWLFIILVGFVFLSDKIWPGIQLKQYAIPGVIIFLGLIFIFSPRGKGVCGRHQHMRRRRHMMRRRFREYYEHPGSENSFAPDINDVQGAQESDDTKLDIVSLFSGVKKKVLSKQFAGGEIVCIFGGSEVNLTNADFDSPIVLDLVQIFGGTKLIVPANWEVRSEVAAVFGGIDDKRPQPTNIMSGKTMVLKGTILFGGVEVNSY